VTNTHTYARRLHVMTNKDEQQTSLSYQWLSCRGLCAIYSACNMLQ